MRASRRVPHPERYREERDHDEQERTRTARRGSRSAIVLLALVTPVLFAACAGNPDPVETAPPETVASDGTTPIVAIPSETPEIATSSTAAPTTTVTRPPGAVGPGTAEAFLELRQEEDGEIVRWYEAGLTVGIAGNPTEIDISTLTSYISSVARIDGVPRLELVETGDPDIVVHFLPKERWREVIGEAIVGADVDGQARYLQVDGGITEVTVVVNSSSSQLQRNRTIVHEMLHAYGMGHHSCPGGLLFDGSEYEPEWRLSEYDRVLLEAWYAEHPGEPQVGVDLPCPGIVWDTILFEGATLWCRIDSGECFDVDVRTGVETSGGPVGWYADGTITTHDPDLYIAFSSENGRVLCVLGEQAYRPCEVGALREVTRPDRWYDGRSLYDYNPETYLVRIFEGRRLLCEKPSGNRAPCQFTDGQTLTGIDLYTDGEFVYETP